MISAAVALIGASPRLAHADHPAHTLRVGVVPGIAVNLDAAKVDALSQDFAEALSSELDVAAIGGLDVRRALPPEGVSADCFTLPACVSDVAKRLNVEQLLFVVMVDTGGSVQVDVTWVDPATGHSASRPAIDLATIGNARARFANDAHLMLPDAPLRAKPTNIGGASLSASDGRPRHWTLPAIVTGSVAVVGFGTAIGFGLDTRSHYNSCDHINCSQSRRDSIRTTGITADVGLVIGIGAAIASTILYTTSAEAPHFMVAPTPTGVAVSTGWSF